VLRAASVSELFAAKLLFLGEHRLLLVQAPDAPLQNGRLRVYDRKLEQVHRRA